MNIIFNQVESKNYDNDCSICLNYINDKEIVIECNRCKKQFHVNCLKKWISHKELCPNCRNKVNSDDEIYFELLNSVIIFNNIYEMNLFYHELTMVYMFVFIILKFFFVILFLIIIFFITYYIKLF